MQLMYNTIPLKAGTLTFVAIIDSHHPNRLRCDQGPKWFAYAAASVDFHVNTWQIVLSFEREQKYTRF